MLETLRRLIVVTKNLSSLGAQPNLSEQGLIS
jgi:hypothetical protein